MKNPKLSILVAAYNAEKYLDACIQSVLSQNYRDYELIIVNDGSNDRTESICQKFALMDKRVKVFSWENHGLILARRKGVEIATGDYILFLDADDMYVKDALSFIVAELTEEIDVLIYRFQFIYDATNEIAESGMKEKRIYNEQEKEALFLGFINNYEFNHMWSKVIRRKLLLKDKFDYTKVKDIRLGEDLLQSIFIYDLAKNVRLSNKVIYQYRVLKKSMSHGFDERHFFDISKVYRIFEAYLKNASWGTQRCLDEMYKAYSLKISGILRDLWKSNDILEKKKKISIIITRENEDMVRKEGIVLQNRILWTMCKNQMWRLVKIYIRIIEKCRNKK